MIANPPRKWLRSADLLSRPRQILPAAFKAAHEDGDWLFLCRDRVGTEMASPAADFSVQRLCSGRRGPLSLTGLVEPTVAALNPGRASSSWTAASRSGPGDTSLPLASPRRRGSASGRAPQPAPARLQGGESCREERGDFTRASPAAPTAAARERSTPGGPGSNRLPLALSEKRKAGQHFSLPSLGSGCQLRRRHLQGGRRLNCAWAPSKMHQVKSWVTSRTPAPLNGQSWCRVFLPRSWWPDFLFPLQGRKNQWDNLRERTKVAPPRLLKEPRRLPSFHSWDFLGGWHFFPQQNFLLIYHFLNPCFVPNTAPSVLSRFLLMTALQVQRG